MDVMLQWDIRTWIILGLCVVVLCMALFGSGGGSAELKALLEEREAQNKELRDSIAGRFEEIKTLRDSADFYMEQARLKDTAIAEMEKTIDRQQSSIDALRRRMVGIAKPIEDATDERRLELWSTYFERKGIKE